MMTMDNDELDLEFLVNLENDDGLDFDFLSVPCSDYTKPAYTLLDLQAITAKTQVGIKYINGGRDISAYEHSDYACGYDSNNHSYSGEHGHSPTTLHPFLDLNVLHDAFYEIRAGSAWKPQMQRTHINLLPELVSTRDDLATRKYRLRSNKPFVLNERGKSRYITGDHPVDRMVKAVLCNQLLLPKMRPKLIHDNGASLEGRGLDFSRRRVVTHLRKYYRAHGNNDGYILLMDYSKFFDNLRHSIVRQQFADLLGKDDRLSLFVVDQVLESSRVDVSLYYDDDEQFENAMSEVFDSLQWYKVVGNNRGSPETRWLEKGMHIGDHTAQLAGIYYPTPIDNYIKIVLGLQYYGRYMDDSYIIHESKEYLEHLVIDLQSMCEKHGLHMNSKKIEIRKLSTNWTYLQTRYKLTDTGRIERQVNPKRLSATKQRLKKMRAWFTPQELTEYYGSWYASNKHRLSYKQQQSMETAAYDILSDADAYGV